MDSPTIIAADYLATGNDRIDGPTLAKGILWWLAGTQQIRVDFCRVGTLTPTLVNEALLTVADRIGHDAFKQRVQLTGVTSAQADVIKRSFAIAARNAAADDQMTRPSSKRS